MAAITGMIIVGEPHVNDGGLTSITEPLLLWEGSRAAWTTQARQKRFSLIPANPDTVFDDGLLLLTVRELGWTDSDELAYKIQHSYKVDLQSEIGEDLLMSDYRLVMERARAFVPYNGKKIVISVFEGSTLLNQISSLASWPNLQIELLTPKYSRQYNRWRNEFMVNGSIA